MRFRSTLISLIPVALAAPSALAQSTPEATLARFIELANAGELTTREGQALLTGEAKEMATAAKSNLPAADKVVAVSPIFAAARIVLHSPAGEEANAYFYLEKTAAGWAVSAFRQMAVSGMDMMLLAEMLKQKQLPPDDQLRRRNLELTLATDPIALRLPPLLRHKLVRLPEQRGRCDQLALEYVGWRRPWRREAAPVLERIAQAGVARARAQWMAGRKPMLLCAVLGECHPADESHVLRS
jgi:hypothetical protein